MFKRAARVPALTALILGALLFFPVLFPAQVQAAEKNKAGQVKSNDFPPIVESKAYQQFKTRPVSDLSKLIYLIDRFGATKIEIVYNGHYYKSIFAASLAKFFLSQNYRKETVDQWIMKWCNVSIPSGNLIWVKFPNNKFKLSRDVLRAELVELEAAMKADQTHKTAVETSVKESLAVPPQASTQHELLEKTANAATPLETGSAAALANTQPQHNPPPSLAS